MEINFSTKELRDLCEVEATAITQLGTTAAESLKNRISDMRVADCIHDVLAGHPTHTYVGSTEYYQFELADQFVLTITANHAKPRLLAEGKVDWQRVRRIKVTSIEQ